MSVFTFYYVLGCSTCGAELLFIYFPISDEFVLQKLKREHVDEGAYLVRWSVLDYRRIILAVLSRTEVPFTYMAAKTKVAAQNSSSS